MLKCVKIFASLFVIFSKVRMTICSVCQIFNFLLEICDSIKIEFSTNIFAPEVFNVSWIQRIPGGCEIFPVNVSIVKLSSFGDVQLRFLRIFHLINETLMMDLGEFHALSGVERLQNFSIVCVVFVSFWPRKPLPDHFRTISQFIAIKKLNFQWLKSSFPSSYRTEMFKKKNIFSNNQVKSSHPFKWKFSSNW